MQIQDMNIHFIKHSSFLVETAAANFLFDYFEGELPEVSQEKPLIVLASHSHGDHFSTKVFRAVENFGDVRFVLSDDIAKNLVPEQYRGKTDFIAAHQTLSLPNAEISTLQSTDMGVAFILETGGKTIYHAGDLNAWVWTGAPAGQNHMMQQIYTQEVSRLKGSVIDLAFVPLDPRQEEEFSLGMEIFLREVSPKAAVPMHMWGDDSVVSLFREKFPQWSDCLHW